MPSLSARSTAARGRRARARLWRPGGLAPCLIVGVLLALLAAPGVSPPPTAAFPNPLAAPQLVRSPAGSVPVNTTWTELSSETPGVVARMGAAAAYDPRTSSVIMVGGFGANAAPLQSCWSFSDGVWTDCLPSAPNATNFPAARSNATLVYDAAIGGLILFGGQGIHGALGDTWEYTSNLLGADWTQITGGNSPPARHLATAAYDAATGSIMLYGGRSANLVYRDAWGLEPGAPPKWINLTASRLVINTTNFPPRLFSASMFYNPISRALEIFGGYTYANGSYYASNATWRYDGSDLWSSVNFSVAPSPRGQAQFAWIPGYPYGLLYGGSGDGGPTLGDEWSFNDTAGWTPMTPGVPAPAPRSGGTFVGVPDGTPPGFGLLFGGNGSTGALLNDTWTLGGLPLLAPPLLSSARAVDAGTPVVLTIHPRGAAEPYGFAWSQLPGGCLGSDVPTLTCIPTAPGNSSPTVQVSSPATTVSLVRSVNLTVNPLPTVTSVSTYPTSPSAGVPFTVEVVVTGGTAPFRYSYSGLPTGCASADASALACTTNSTGTYDLRVQVVDADGVSANGSVAITLSSGASAPARSYLKLLEIGAALGAVAVIGVFIGYRIYRGRRRSGGSAGTPTSSRRPPKAGSP